MRDGLGCGAVRHRSTRSTQGSDCAADFNNPSQAYAPADLYRVRVVVHVITNGEIGRLSEACVRNGIKLLNRDFRGRKSTELGVDTRIEVLCDPAALPKTRATL